MLDARFLHGHLFSWWLESASIPSNKVGIPSLKTVSETFDEFGLSDFHDKHAAYECEWGGVSAMNDMNPSAQPVFGAGREDISGECLCLRAFCGKGNAHLKSTLGIERSVNFLIF